MRVLMQAAALCAVVAAPIGAAAEGPARVAQLDWLAGEWLGEGREEGGAVEGAARLYWTPPIDGAVSNLFTWNTPEDGHVHYALTVFRDADDTIAGRGIHHGRDFETFEDDAWVWRASDIGDDHAEFECVEHCRARSVRFSLLEDGRLEERWTTLSEDDADWVVTYERAAP